MRLHITQDTYNVTPGGREAHLMRTRLLCYSAAATDVADNSKLLSPAGVASRELFINPLVANCDFCLLAGGKEKDEVAAWK